MQITKLPKLLDQTSQDMPVSGFKLQVLRFSLIAPHGRPTKMSTVTDLSIYSNADQDRTNELCNMTRMRCTPLAQSFYRPL